MRLSTIRSGFRRFFRALLLLLVWTSWEEPAMHHYARPGATAIWQLAPLNSPAAAEALPLKLAAEPGVSACAISSQNGVSATDPTRLTRLRNNVVDQFTDITGGPIRYKGINMLVAHTNMRVTDAEYVAWRVLLDNSLTKNNIGAKEKAEFTALIDAMKADVVNH